jgi:hypothetical protein
MWSDELKKIRRLIRDPDGNIWTDAFLRHLWNDVQQDFQNRTSVLEDVAAQRVPDLYHLTYMHDWEWRHLPTSVTEFYQCFGRHGDGTFTHLWEPQQTASSSYNSHTTTAGGFGRVLAARSLAPWLLATRLLPWRQWDDYNDPRELGLGRRARPRRSLHAPLGSVYDDAR